MRFKQTTRVRVDAPIGERGALVESPSVTFVVEVTGALRVSPDAFSTELGHFAGRWLVPAGESYSIRTDVEPWPLPKDWRNVGVTDPTPDLARVLLVVEWIQIRDAQSERIIACPHCFAVIRRPDYPDSDEVDTGHVSDCPIDAALTKAGLPTQAERDGARKAMR